MDFFDRTVVSCVKSILAYFGKRDCAKKSKSWLDAYKPTDIPPLMLSKFEHTFGEDPFLFGVSFDNVRLLAETLAKVEYRNEVLIKSSFINDVLSTKGQIVGYEFPIGENRVDLCAVGDRSVAYEIKTAYDTLNRLEKQLSSYLRAFEFVYVVVEEGKLADTLSIAPNCVGIYSYSDSSQKIRFVLRRRAKRSTQLDATLQKCAFPSLLASSIDTNSAFKSAVQKKYMKSWGFLKSNMEHITLLDYQAAFRLRRRF